MPTTHSHAYTHFQTLTSSAYDIKVVAHPEASLMLLFVKPFYAPGLCAKVSQMDGALPSTFHAPSTWYAAEAAHHTNTPTRLIARLFPASTPIRQDQASPVWTTVPSTVHAPPHLLCPQHMTRAQMTIAREGEFYSYRLHSSNDTEKLMSRTLYQIVHVPRKVYPVVHGMSQGAALHCMLEHVPTPQENFPPLFSGY